MTWGDSPTSAGMAGVGSTSPAWGRPVAGVLLCLLLLCMISGNNFLRAAQPVCFLLGLERFSYGRGRSRPLLMSCCIHVYIISIIVMNSEAAACMMSQHLCTACRSEHSIIGFIALTCFTLPQLFFIFLAYTTYSYTCSCMLHV
jgi:hypothetical protein